MPTAVSGDLAAVMLGGGAALIMTLFWLTARIARKDGFDEGRDYERALHARRALAAAQRAQQPPARLIEQPWPYHGHGRHSVWAQRMTVRTDTIAFAGGPATVPISHRSDSGELRALVTGTDRYIEDMRRREDVHRRQLAIR